MSAGRPLAWSTIKQTRALARLTSMQRKGGAMRYIRCGKQKLELASDNQLQHLLTNHLEHNIKQLFSII